MVVTAGDREYHLLGGVGVALGYVGAVIGIAIVSVLIAGFAIWDWLNGFYR